MAWLAHFEWSVKWQESAPSLWLSGFGWARKLLRGTPPGVAVVG